MSRKTVLLLGAGASIADVVTSPLIARPPLDARFFRLAFKAVPNDSRAKVVRDYFANRYALDITADSSDSLEGVMARIYPDVYNELLSAEALRAFRSLLELFTARLANTTNQIAATQKRLLYRMLVQLLSSGVEPADITIITFNQDIQVEKNLELLSQAKRWQALEHQLFSFPGMYAIDRSAWHRVTVPTGARPDDPKFFALQDERGDCIRLLKLHGSLNWYSTHRSRAPTRDAMFRTDRRLSLTRRKDIAPDMTLNRRRGREYTLPVVVPPVNHKSAVLHDLLQSVWALAEQRLNEADDLIVFGYSCPPLDFESANLLMRTHQRRPVDATTCVIDPNGAVAMRYIDLLHPARLRYYRTAADFLRQQ